MASENGAFRRKLALRHGIREDRQSIPAAVSLLAGGLSVLGQRQRSTAWAGASASPQKADQNTSHTSRLWHTIVDHWPPEVKWETPQPGKMSTETRTIGFASVTSECKPQQAATNRAAGRDDCDHGP